MNAEQPHYLPQLRQLIDAYFNLSELRDLCFDLGVDPEHLPGEEKRGVIRSLLLHLARRQELGKLLDRLRTERPSVAWPDVPTEVVLAAEIEAWAAESQVTMGNITVQGNVGAGAAVGPGAKVEAEIIAGRDVKIENYYGGRQKPKPAYTPPPLPHIDTLCLPGALPPGSYLTHSRNPYFTGRERELLTLAQTLLYESDGRDVIVSQTAVASGLGGIGKTQLAVEFAHRYGRYFAGGVYWLNCATAEGIPAELAVIGGENGMGLYQGADGLTLDDQIGRVKQAWQEPAPRLLIFDNCEEEAVLDAWRPVTGGCRVLVTSRQGQWAGTLGVTHLSLGVLTRPKSVALLRRFVPKIEDKDAEAIAHELGDLPLALHLAGSYMKRYGQMMTAATYLVQLREKKLLAHSSMQGRGAELSPTDHELHVGRTFALSYGRLNSKKATDKIALAWLARAACFVPGEMIPAELLSTTLSSSKQAMPSLAARLQNWWNKKLSGPDQITETLAQDGLNRLVSLGLLAQEGETGYQLHRLLSLYVAEKLVADMEQARTEVEQIMVEKATELNQAGYPAPLLIWQNQLRYVAEGAADRDSEWAGGLLNELGYHLHMIADYTGARVQYERALSIWEKVLGPNDPDTATSLNNLGMLLDSMGDLAGAWPYVERALGIREKALGPNDPDTANSLNNAGGLLKAMGDLAGARPYYERALDIREKVLGPNHPDTATSLNNLGMLLLAMGDNEAARPYLQRALDIRGKVLGPAHPDMAESLNNLGYFLYTTGDLAEALPYYERALDIREKVLGPDDPDTSISLNNLGALLDSRGNYQAARTYYERALDIRERVLGPDHPDTATSLNNLGMLLQDMEDYAAARPYYERALAIDEKALGPVHPDTASDLNNLGSLLEDMGDDEAARPYYERALAIFEQVLGPDHSRTQMVRRNLAGLEDGIKNKCD